MKKKPPREVRVPFDFMAKVVWPAYCADLLPERIRPPFAFEGAWRVATALIHHGGETTHAVTYELIPVDRYTGKIRDTLRDADTGKFSYCGVRVTWRKHDYVLDRELEFTGSADAEWPDTTPPVLPDEKKKPASIAGLDSVWG